MVIDPQSATHFIAGYKSLLTEIHRLGGEKAGKKILEMLIAARETAISNPELIMKAARTLESRGEAVPEDVLNAAKTLKLKQWVFLRDTTKYSVFIEPGGRDAYAVVGLTERIREIVGGSAAVMKTGVVEYRGRYVCDGLIGNLIWLGSNLKREFAATLSELRRSGCFHVECNS